MKITMQNIKIKIDNEWIPLFQSDKIKQTNQEKSDIKNDTIQSQQSENN